MFKSLDSQTALGKGYTNASAFRTTGATNTKGMNYGTNTATAANDIVKFLGMEDFWGNLLQWVDGYVSGNGVVLIGDGNFNDTGSGYESHARSGQQFNYPQYIKDVEAGNITAFTPKTGGGSETTYFSDYGYMMNSVFLPIFGGYRSSGAYAGAFYFSCYYSASIADSSVGARLCFCG